MNLVLLDIDGTLIPSGKMSPDDETVHVHADYQASFNASVPLMEAIAELNGDLTWLSTWGAQSNEAFGAVFGQLPVLYSNSTSKWWKCDALLRYATRTLPSKPERIVWFDDELEANAEDVAQLHIDLAVEGIHLLCIETHLLRGIQPADIEQAAQFLAAG